MTEKILKSGWQGAQADEREVKKAEVSIARSSVAEYLSFVAASGQGGAGTIYADESIWLTQKMMAVLYGVNVRTVNEHLKKIFADRELQEDSGIRKFRIPAADGKNHNTRAAQKLGTKRNELAEIALIAAAATSPILQRKPYRYLDPTGKRLLALLGGNKAPLPHGL